jgi:hypothetical protein
MYKPKRSTVYCDCENPAHQMIIDITEPDEVIIWIHLTPVSFIKRCVYAFQYIFGIGYPLCEYGFDEIRLNKDKVDEIRSALDAWELDNISVVDTHDDITDEL